MSKSYNQIQTPCVIVVGEKDPFPTKEHSFKLYNAMPNAKLIALPHVAHMIPHNHPHAVVGAVEALIHEFQA